MRGINKALYNIKKYDDFLREKPSGFCNAPFLFSKDKLINRVQRNLNFKI